MDLVEAIAAEPPALVLLEMLGLHDVDVPALKAWSRESLELFWGWPDEDRQLELAHSAAEFYGWLRKPCRRSSPRSRATTCSEYWSSSG